MTFVLLLLLDDFNGEILSLLPVYLAAEGGEEGKLRKERRKDGSLGLEKEQKCCKERQKVRLYLNIIFMVHTYDDLQYIHIIVM